MKVATLTQRMDELDEHLDDPVRVVHRPAAHQLHVRGRLQGAGTDARASCWSGSASPRAQLSTPVKDLSGGQQRRLQLLLILLDQPNVLILDEPTNDLDTDMLAAMEDLLDSWPGTLIVVSHDRYFLERVTDQQYAILDGRLRHLPGGVDEYLRLRAAKPRVDRRGRRGPDRRGARGRRGRAATTDGLSGAELRAAQKELTAIERRLARLDAQVSPGGPHWPTTIRPTTSASTRRWPRSANSSARSRSWRSSGWS